MDEDLALVRQWLEVMPEGRFDALPSPLAFENLKILRTEDPQLFVATANASAVMASGRPYANSYVIFVRLRESQVAEHTEYLNPLKVIEAMSAS
jgi:ketosteroid isomerase-like protein